MVKLLAFLACVVGATFPESVTSGQAVYAVLVLPYSTISFRSCHHQETRTKTNWMVRGAKLASVGRRFAWFVPVRPVTV